MKLYYKIIDGEPIYSNCKTIVLVKTTPRGHSISYTITNPSEDQISEAGWLEYVPTGEEALQTAKEAKLNEITEYDSSENVNEFSINAQSMWLDHNTRQQLKTSVEAYASSGAETVTKIFNDTEYTFTPEQWLQMLVLLEIYASDALNVTERHKLAVKNLTSVQEVEDYDYTTGYPSKLQF